MPKAIKKTTASETNTRKAVKDVNQIKNNLTALFSSIQLNRRTYLIILIIGLLLVAFYKKSWFVAATVNGMPISNFEVLSRMNQQYRTQILNQMVNEKIINDEAKKNNIAVNSAEVDNKVTQLEANVGGIQALDSLLSQQGQTRASLKDQLKIQIMIEKLYANDATSSADEITKFIEENKDQLQATTSAEQTKEAEEIIKQQKLSKVFSQKFQELKQAAQVKIF